MTTDQSQHLATNTIEEINAAGALQKGRPHPALLRIQQSFDTQSAIPGPFTNTYQTPFESTVKSGPPPYFPYPTNAQLNKAQLSKSQLQALRAAAPGVTKPGRMTRASLTPTIRKYFEDNGNEWAGSWSIFNNEKYTVKYKSETAKKGSGTLNKTCYRALFDLVQLGMLEDSVLDDNGGLHRGRNRWKTMKNNNTLTPMTAGLKIGQNYKRSELNPSMTTCGTIQQIIDRKMSIGAENFDTSTASSAYTPFSSFSQTGMPYFQGFSPDSAAFEQLHQLTQQDRHIPHQLNGTSNRIYQSSNLDPPRIEPRGQFVFNAAQSSTESLFLDNLMEFNSGHAINQNPPFYSTHIPPGYQHQQNQLIVASKNHHASEPMYLAVEKSNAVE